MARVEPWLRDHGTWKVVGVAVLARLLAFPFAENKQADAPMRALLAEHRNLAAGAAADPRTFYQFGPLPIEVVRPFLAFGGDARWRSRVPSLLAGLALFFPFFALARRMAGGRHARLLAALALALSPLAVQLAITAASESFYLLFWLACLERLHAAITGWGQDRPGEELAGKRSPRLDFMLAGACASLAAVSRYDAWLALPAMVAVAWLVGPRDRAAAVDLLVFLASAAALPAAYLLWLRMAGADPWFFARTIAHEHAAAAAGEAERLGGGPARVHQLAVWMLAFSSAMTPAGVFGLLPAARRWRRSGAATRVVVVGTLAPLLVYLVQGLVLDAFAPLARFALVPGVVLLPLAFDAFRLRPRSLALAVALSALLFATTTSLLAFAHGGRTGGEAEAVAPVTRIAAEDRAVAEYLARDRRPEEAVFVDTFQFTDIQIAHAARIPLARMASLVRTRMLCDTLAEERARSQATIFAAHDASWGRKSLSDWPTGGVRLGHWRIVRLQRTTDTASVTKGAGRAGAAPPLSRHGVCSDLAPASSDSTIGRVCNAPRSDRSKASEYPEAPPGRSAWPDQGYPPRPHATRAQMVRAGNP